MSNAAAVVALRTETFFDYPTDNSDAEAKMDWVSPESYEEM